MDSSYFVRTIVAASAIKGINQKELARRAGIPEVTLSRMKKGGNPTLTTLDSLARVAGLQLSLSPIAAEGTLAQTSPIKSQFPSTPAAFRKKYRVLIWSNSKANDAAYIKKALLAPRFPVLLDAAVSFGLARIQAEWILLQAEETPEVKRAFPVTQRLLRNIQHGYEQAKS